MKIDWKAKTKLDRAGIKAVRLLNESGFQAFWVGGAVRDILMKVKTEDLDIATDATPTQVEKVFKAAKITTKPVGKKFGTVLVVIDKFAIEVTTFRTEGRYEDLRHPNEVTFVKDYLTDAKRRDFTINAMYFNAIEKFIYDPTGGQNDLRQGILKLVGNPIDRINEDALRMLRAVRFSVQLGMKIESNTFASIKTRVKFVQSLSGERVKKELDKILGSPNRIIGLKLLDQIGLLQYIIPELQKLKTIQHNAGSFHLEGSIFNHLMKAVEILQVDDLDLVYTMLFHDIGKVVKPVRVPDKNPKGWRWSFRGHVEKSGEIFSAFADKYRFPSKSKKRILHLIKHHEDRTRFMKMTEREQIAYLLQTPELEALFEVWWVDSAANLRLVNGEKVWGNTASVPAARKLLKRIQKSQKLFALADGNHVMKFLKMKSSSTIGKIILQIKIEIVLGKIKNKVDLKNFLENSRKTLDKQ
jgi:tRNA nucleotidyltransferase/poly(A) polymerase